MIGTKNYEENPNDRIDKLEEEIDKLKDGELAMLKAIKILIYKVEKFERRCKIMLNGDKETCPVCDGSGIDMDGKTCDCCGGTGQIDKQYDSEENK
jgi:RecJ-like exonuclease